MSFNIDLKKEIVQSLSKETKVNSLLFSLFTFASYKKLGNNYLFRFKDDFVIDFVIDFLKENSPKTFASKVKKGDYQYLLFESKPSYHTEYDDDGVPTFSKEDSKYIFLSTFLFVGKIKPFTKTLFELRCREDNIDILIQVIKNIDSFNFNVVEKNSNIYMYSKNATHIFNFFKNFSDLDSIDSEFNQKMENNVVNYYKRNNIMEVSNIKKTSDFTFRVLKKVEELKENGTYSSLDSDVKKLLELKIDNPELSISELAEKLSIISEKDIKKQRIAYLFKKLEI